jgi:hypothetical protein
VGELPESVIEDLRVAGVAPVPGMLLTSPGRYIHEGTRVVSDPGEAVHFDGDDWYGSAIGGKVNEYVAGLVPDPRDRGTFLLLCDEAERRRGLPKWGGGFRSARLWDDAVTRPRLIAALARALRESAPGEAR